MRLGKITPLFTASIICIFVGTMSFAHDGATGIVKDRMIAMETLGKTMKTLSNAIKADAPVDELAQAARAIREHAGQNMIDLFPDHSLQAASQARPEIWDNWDRFVNLSMELESIATELATGSGNQPPDVLFKSMTRTCAACHEEFRIKK